MLRRLDAGGVDPQGALLGVGKAAVLTADYALNVGESGTMVMTTSASLTASAMLVAPWPPSEISLSILSWLRLKPVTV